MAIKLSEPLGNPLFAGLFVRLPLGVYFVMAGLMKLNTPEAFVVSVRKFGILPEPLATLYGILLPYVEIAAGALMALGFWTTLSAILTSLMLLSFVIAFGIRDQHPFNKDLILLFASISILFSGSGAWSIDRFRKNA